MTPADSPPLFVSPSTFAARARFRAKDRSLRDKVMSVADAVREFVHDGEYFCSGGFGANRLPAAVCHEVLRQGKQGLSFAGHTATHDFQLLCAGNLLGRGQTLRRVDAAYIVGLEARGLSPHARRVMESGEIECVEWSNYALAVRFQAAATGVPFIPTHTLLGADTGKHSAAKEIQCPFTGAKLMAIPALYPDVAAIHVHEADRYGNCRIRGVNVADSHLARAAHRVIITCERLVPTEEIRRDPTATAIPFFCVDAVCEVPYGSYPGNMAYEYFSDEEHLKRWLAVEEDLDEFKRFVEEFIYGLKDFNEYLMKCGGLPRLQQLRRQEWLL
jgi:glutaconate CoA-transferase subunit A